MLTVITPTTGRDSLFNAIQSLKNQTSHDIIRHIILWDDKRSGSFLFPDPNEMSALSPDFVDCTENYYSAHSIIINGNFIQGKAAGSSLRAVGLMVANSKWVTFMDDDVMWDSNHVESMFASINQSEWGFCKRRIWTTSKDEYECLGVDDFESVGEDAKTPYKMVDNNCMMFKREYGVSAACLYRNTNEYNDDRLMYNFLMKHAGKPAKTESATINQVCPEHLIGFFETNCTKKDEI